METTTMIALLVRLNTAEAALVSALEVAQADADTDDILQSIIAMNGINTALSQVRYLQRRYKRQVSEIA